jgi:hypothetical protein
VVFLFKKVDLSLLIIMAFKTMPMRIKDELIR